VEFSAVDECQTPSIIHCRPLLTCQTPVPSLQSPSPHYFPAPYLKISAITDVSYVFQLISS